VFINIQLIISKPTHTLPSRPLWIHCCKRPNYDV